MGFNDLETSVSTQIHYPVIPVKGSHRYLEWALANIPGYSTRPYGNEVPKSLDVDSSEILAIDIVVDDLRSSVDLRKAYRDNEESYDNAVIKAVRDEVGSEPDIFFYVRPGSSHTSLGVSPPRKQRFSLRRIVRSTVEAVRKTTARIDKDFRPIFTATFKVLSLTKDLVVVGLQIWNLWTGAPSPGSGETAPSPAIVHFKEWLERISKRRGFPPPPGFSTS